MDATTQLLVRYLAVVFGGLFSWSMIDLVVRNHLRYYLADEKFELLVAVGGILLGLVVLLKFRALLIGRDAHAHDHSHDHGHTHDHDHDHGDHHSHDVSLWRYIVLAIPLMIVLMGLAPRGLSAAALDRRMTREQREAIAAIGNVALPAGRSAAGKMVAANVKELMDAAADPVRREFWESTANPVQARVKGQFVPDARYPDRYRLMRIKITCCAADATPLGVTVIGKPQPGWKYGDWIEVEGPVSFVEVPASKGGASRYIPAIYQQKAIPLSSPPPDLYIQ